MKKVLLLLVIPLIGASCAANQPASNNQTSQSSTTGKGRLVLAITDAATNLQNINAITLSVDKTEVHSSGQGWVTVSTQPNDFDLLKLKTNGQAALLSDSMVNSGTYDQIRLHVSSAKVIQSDGSHDAKLPSNDLKLVGNIIVDENSTASGLIDFKMDNSVHQTGNGQFIITPVVQFSSRSQANVAIDANNLVTINGGIEESNNTLGMDENGDMKANFMLDSSVKLNLIGDDTIHILNSGQSEAAAKVNADQAVSKAKQNGDLDTVLSVKLETRNGKSIWHVVGLRNLQMEDVYVDANSGIIVTGN
jgi:Domain of unknown function (DUF4382)